MGTPRQYDCRRKVEHIFIVEAKDLNRLLVSILNRSHIGAVSIKYSATVVAPNQVVFAVIVPLTFYELRNVVTDLGDIFEELTVSRV